MEQGTVNVDPYTPVGHHAVQVPVTWDIESPGVVSGSLAFPTAEIWICQMAENVVPGADGGVTRRAGNADQNAYVSRLETWSR